MSDKNTARPAPFYPVSSGLRGRCPRCGEGRLFDGYLKVDTKCARYRLDCGFADAGDGPAVFVILLTGFLVVGLALWGRSDIRTAALAASGSPLAIVLCLWSLRALKGVLINMQYRHNAHDGEIDHG